MAIIRKCGQYPPPPVAVDADIARDAPRHPTVELRAHGAPGWVVPCGGRGADGRADASGIRPRLGGRFRVGLAALLFGPKSPPQILRERALAPAEGVEPLPQRPATCCARRGGAAVREDAVSAVFRMQFYIPGSGGVCNS